MRVVGARRGGGSSIPAVLLAAALLVLVAAGLFVAGLTQGATVLLWASFAGSLTAALLPAVGALARRARARRTGPRRAVAEPSPGPSDPARSAPAAPPWRAELTDTGPIPLATGSHAVPVPATGSHAVPVPATGSHAVPVPATGSHAVPVPATGSHAVPVPATGSHAVRVPVSGSHAVWQSARPVPVPAEPPVEEVGVADLLLVLDLATDVLVVDRHPRYHLPGCRHAIGASAVPLPMVDARTDGFTPCGVCTLDHVLAERERAHRTA